MPSERYYLSEKFIANEKKALKGAEFHHLAHVMRTRKGERVELVNGKGSLAFATVSDILKDQAIVHIDQVEESSVPSTRIILAQALPKPNRLDFILEKGTELGVDEFWLFPGNTSSKKEIYPSQIERAQSITIAAMKQCGRLDLPSVIIKPEIKLWPHFISTSLFGDVQPSAEWLSKTLKANAINYPIIFVTGPESGFTESEVELLKEKGAKGVKLHENILRTDTASLAAITLIHQFHQSS